MTNYNGRAGTTAKGRPPRREGKEGGGVLFFFAFLFNNIFLKTKNIELTVVLKLSEVHIGDVSSCILPA